MTGSSLPGPGPAQPKASSVSLLRWGGMSIAALIVLVGVLRLGMDVCGAESGWVAVNRPNSANQINDVTVSLRCTEPRRSLKSIL